MTFKMRLYSLIALFVTSLIILSGGAYMTSTDLSRGIGLAYQDGINLGYDIDALRKAQVAFQRQVQEWKNTLIRGADDSDTELYDKHWASFISNEAKFRDEISGLKKLLQQDQIETFNAQIDDLMKEHALLGEKYRTAISSYDRKDKTSYIKTDKMLRGIDRPASAKMDTLAGDIEKFVSVKFEEHRTESQRQASNATWVTIILSVAVIIAGTLVALYTVFKLISIIGGEPEQVAVIVRKIAAGDLNVQYEVRSKNDSNLLAQVGIMQMKLRTMVKSISMASSEMRHAISAAEDNLNRSVVPDGVKEALDKKLQAINRVSRGMEVSVERFSA